MVNIVTIADGKKYMVDVGFGGNGPTQPLLLDAEHSLVQQQMYGLCMTIFQKTLIAAKNYGFTSIEMMHNCHGCRCTASLSWSSCLRIMRP